LAFLRNLDERSERRETAGQSWKDFVTLGEQTDGKPGDFAGDL